MPADPVSILVSPGVAAELPADPAERDQVLQLGLREWRIRRALAAYERGEGSLAYAAEQAGVRLREMIPLAYAHGLQPRVDRDLLRRDDLSLDEAADL